MNRMLLNLITGNGELGTGNWELGTGVWERVYGAKEFNMADKGKEKGTEI